MFSVIVRTQNAEAVLLQTLRPLISAAAEGLVLDVAFADIGSQDGTSVIASAAGAEFVSVRGSEDPTESVARAAHRGSWVLLLEQGTVVSASGMTELASFAEAQARARASHAPAAACFRPAQEARSAKSLKRVASMWSSNKLGSRAWLSQGVLLHRTYISGSARSKLDIDWTSESPSIALPRLVRLNSTSHCADPLHLDAEDDARVAGRAVPHPG